MLAYMYIKYDDIAYKLPPMIQLNIIYLTLVQILQQS